MEEQVIQTKKPRSKFEWVIIAVVMVAAVVMSFYIYSYRDNNMKSKLLRAELENIRSSVELYMKINKTKPASLETLAKLNYSFEPGADTKPYLKGVSLDKEGKILDPFGNPYKYDSNKGWVYSSTKGFEKW